MRRIKVLHLLTSLAPGGAETNLLALLKHFDHKRFEHAVAFGGGGALEEEFLKTGVKLIPLSNKSLTFRACLNFDKKIRKIKGFCPDIIHSHLDIPNVLGLIAKYFLKTKLVLHFHGLGIIPLSKLPGRSLNHLFWNLIAKTYSFCDKAISICSFQVPFITQIGINENDIVMIPNGITLSDNSEVGIRPDKKYCFVNVARFFPQKDHDLLIMAFQKANLVNPNIRLLLVGDGPLREECQRKVNSLGLSDKIDFLGVRRDIPEILSSSSCFVLSSKWELHPITILEAMRAALPVIATKVGGIPDTITENETGLLIDPNDVDGLASAMINLSTNPELSCQMGCKGLEKLNSMFSNKLVSQKIEKIYTSVIGEYVENY